MIRIFHVSIPASVLLLILSEALLIAVCYVLAAFLSFSIYSDPWVYFIIDNGWLPLLLAVLVVQIGLYLNDLYDDIRLRYRALLIQQLCMLLGVSFLIQALVGYSESTLLQLPQWTMLYGSGFVLVVIPSWRLLFFSLIRQALPNKKVLFLGWSPESRELMDSIQARPDLGYTVAGYLHTEPKAGPYLGGLEQMEEVLQLHRPSMIVIEDQTPLPVQEIVALKQRGKVYQVQEVETLYEMVFGRVPLRRLNPSHVLLSTEFRPKPWVADVQMAYSFVLALIGLLLCLPIMAVVYLLVRLTSPGPALYKQKRVGRNSMPFFVYKFRSMFVDAETRTGPVWATKHDPRITPVGRWLRKLRLDETPQFFNVLRGEMALVGPRPERPEFCEILAQKMVLYHQRHVVRPGITGWAQINHKYTDTIEDSVTKLEYDLYYVKHMEPALDIYIIFHTIKVMLLFRGAQ
jgi:exopolysaccharide biosynthesis polyprenyl glycosylphosphotransferase